MKLKSKRTLVLLGVIAVVAFAAVGAYAYFTSTGSGSGSASVGTSSAWAVTTDAATGGPLSPGGPSESVGYHVKNNNSGQQYLAQVVIKVANSDGTPWTSVAGCSASDFSVDGGVAGAPATDSPAQNLASGAQYDGSISIQMVDSGSNQDGCKNATVPLYLSAS